MTGRRTLDRKSWVWILLCSEIKMMMKLPILPCAEKTRKLVLSTRETVNFRETETQRFHHNSRTTYISQYWLKAELASISSFRSFSDGTVPSSRGGSYWLLHGDLQMDNKTYTVQICHTNRSLTNIPRTVKLRWPENVFTPNFVSL